MITLEEDNITLREAKKFDCPTLETLANDPLIEMFFFQNTVREEYFKFLNEWNKPRKERDFYGFVIEEDKKAKGFISLVKEDYLSLGYFIGRKYRNKELCFKAVNLIIPFVFNGLKEKELYARVLSENIPSKRLLEKVGFEFKEKETAEGFRKEHELYVLKNPYY
jgi:RimJ/RimL family protein N-acetyltransferase